MLRAEVSEVFFIFFVLQTLTLTLNWGLGIKKQCREADQELDYQFSQKKKIIYLKKNSQVSDTEES